jgi:hypothetical protein
MAAVFRVYLIHEGRQAPMGDMEPVFSDLDTSWCEVFCKDKIK